jgi:hypothetical protein
MRLRSTPDSVRTADVSLLAAVETAAATAVSISLGFWLGTFEHMAIAAVIAPFLLLQSEYSAVYFRLLVDNFVNLDLRSQDFGRIKDRQLLQVLDIPHGRFKSLRGVSAKMFRLAIKYLPPFEFCHWNRPLRATRPLFHSE